MCLASSAWEFASVLLIVLTIRAGSMWSPSLMPSGRKWMTARHRWWADNGLVFGLVVLVFTSGFPLGLYSGLVAGLWQVLHWIGSLGPGGGGFQPFTQVLWYVIGCLWLLSLWTWAALSQLWYCVMLLHKEAQPSLHCSWLSLQVLSLFCWSSEFCLLFHDNPIWLL